MKLFRSVLILALTVAIAGGAVAADDQDAKKAGAKKAAAAKKGEAGKKRKAGARKAPAVSQIMLRGIELTAEQKKAVEPIDKEFAAKLAELRKAQASILTDEQRKIQQAAAAKLRSAGKAATPEQRKELAAQRKAAGAAVKLTDEQKAKQAALRKSQGELREAYLAKVSSILTDEQKEALKKGRRRPGKGAAEGKKPSRKKKDSK